MVQIADLPVRLVKNKLIVDGAINGQKVGVVLDTGAATTMMLRPVTDRLGLERHEARGYRVFGIGGETKAAVLLGEDFFDQVDVEFDLAHHAVRLFQPKNCDGVSRAYWTTEEPREVAIDAIYEYSPRIVLTVQINGQPVKAMLDSGAGTSLLTKVDAARLGVTPETAWVVAVQEGHGLGPKQVNFWVGPFDSVLIGNEIISHPNIPFGDLYKDMAYASIGRRLAKSAEQEQPMLLGADFLQAHRVLVSHSQRKMYFTHLGGPVFAGVRPSEAGTVPRPDKDASPKSREK